MSNMMVYNYLLEKWFNEMTLGKGKYEQQSINWVKLNIERLNGLDNQNREMKKEK